MHKSDHGILQREGVPLPAYYRLQEALRGKIEDGHWKPGDAIPSERLITEEYRISAGTVKKALGNLVDEGYLYRVQGKGTFVGKSILRQESLRYYRLVREFGDGMAELNVKLLGIREVKGFEPANRFLRIAGDHSLFEMRRLFSSNEKPVVYAVSYIPKTMFPGFETISASRLENSTFYEVIEKDYGIPTIRNQELFGAALADAKTAGVLKIGKDEPLLTIEMLSYTYKNMPYEYRLSYCLTSGHRILAEIR
ncbi:MAG TPA: GntR family transcriptional regulator [Desulfomonilia bacterium]